MIGAVDLLMSSPRHIILQHLQAPGGTCRPTSACEDESHITVSCIVPRSKERSISFAVFCEVCESETDSSPICQCVPENRSSLQEKSLIFGFAYVLARRAALCSQKGGHIGTTRQQRFKSASDDKQERVIYGRGMYTTFMRDQRLFQV